MTVTFDVFLVGLEARKQGEQWVARCPAHDDGTPSLGIKCAAGRAVIYCHAGCEFSAVVELLEARGLWPVEVESLEETGAAPVAAAGKRDILPILHRINEGLRPLANTRADHYLTGRGIKIRSPEQELTYHPSLFHGWSHTWWPAMVATVREVQGHPVDFQRTWLSIAQPITKAKLRGEGLDPPRAWVGRPWGCTVQLAPAAPTLIIGEGIETVLSAMQLYGLPGWAALTAGNLGQVQLPPIVREVIILVDNDDAGRRGAMAAAQLFYREGLRVKRIRSPVGNDFNDLLLWQLQQENNDA